MLKLDPNHLFLADVTVAIKGLQASFKARLRLLDAARVDELQAKVKDGSMTGLDFARAVLEGWPAGEVLDENDQPIPNGPEGVERLLGQPGVAGAVVRAFWTGYEPANEGNSEPLPAG